MKIKLSYKKILIVILILIIMVLALIIVFPYLNINQEKDIISDFNVFRDFRQLKFKTEIDRHNYFLKKYYQKEIKSEAIIEEIFFDEDKNVILLSNKDGDSVWLFLNDNIANKDFKIGSFIKYSGKLAWLEGGYYTKIRYLAVKDGKIKELKEK